MKKRLSILLSMIMLCSNILAGCTSTKEVSESKDNSTTSQTAEEKAKDKTTSDGESDEYKIGVMWYGYTDQLGSSIKKNLEYLGKELNVEFVFVEAILPEDCISQTENLIQNGVNGIMTLALYANMIEQCEQAGVYLGQFCNETQDEEMLKMIAESEYFVGMINENDYACGEAMVDDLYARGCRNIVWLSMAAGAASNHDNRVRGIESAIEKYDDLNVLANYRGDKSGEALQSFAVTYPDMDGVILTGGASGGTEEFYQIMSSEGLSGRVIFATIDIGEGTGDRLENGDLGWIAGGQFATSGIMFSLLYNGITGNKVLEDPTEAMYRKFMVLQSLEDYENYIKYVEGDIPPYSADEIKDLIKVFNEDAGAALYNKYNDNYGIEDVVARHVALID